MNPQDSGKNNLKKPIFWDVVPCEFITNQHFGGMCRLHLQGQRNNTSEEKLDGN
jgi:hypothetical protein